MTADVTSLNEARADKANDCRLWAPTECLKAVLRDIEKGEIAPEQLVIHMLQNRPDGSQRHHFFAAGVTYPQHIALLEVAKHRCVMEWLGRD